MEKTKEYQRIKEYGSDGVFIEVDIILDYETRFNYYAGRRLLTKTIYENDERGVIENVFIPFDEHPDVLMILKQIKKIQIDTKDLMVDIKNFKKFLDVHPEVFEIVRNEILKTNSDMGLYKKTRKGTGKPVTSSSEDKNQ